MRRARCCRNASVACAKAERPSTPCLNKVYHAPFGLDDHAMTVNGVPAASRTAPRSGQAPGLWRRQRWISEGRPCTVTTTVPSCAPRSDLMTTATTATIPSPSRARCVVRTAACAIRFWPAVACMTTSPRCSPSLAPLIKWHLTSTDGPMHYASNTVYMAGDRDHHGLREGEVAQAHDTRWPAALGTGGRQRPGRGAQHHADRPPESGRRDCAPVYPRDAHQWRIAACDTPARVAPRHAGRRGKARELDHARSAAVWPEATDEELQPWSLMPCAPLWRLGCLV